jgi:hypothetical protein
MARSRVDLDAALDDFAAAAPGVDKLSMIVGFRAIADSDRKAYNDAVRYLDRDSKKITDRIARALASLPQEAAGQLVLRRTDPQYGAAKDAVLADVRQQLDELEASEQGLRTFDRSVAKIIRPARRQRLDAILPADDRATLDQDIAARKAAIEQALIAAEQDKLQAMPDTAASLRQIENASGSGLASALSPEAKESYRALLQVRRQAVALALIDAVSADLQGLASLPELHKGLQNSPGGLASDGNLAVIDQAIAAKQAAIGKDVAQDMLAKVAGIPLESRAFAALDGYADQRILRLLASDDADAVVQAVGRRRAEIGDELYAKLTAELAEMADSEKSLAVIDTALLPGIEAWPASASDQRTRFLQAVVDKRTSIVAVLTRAQRGPLRGRVYADRAGTTKLEFGDDGKAYYTAVNSQTLVTPYEEESETRVLVTMPQGIVVFTREGRWLVGGPLQLQRLDD